MFKLDQNQYVTSLCLDFNDLENSSIEVSNCSHFKFFTPFIVIGFKN